MTCRIILAFWLVINIEGQTYKDDIITFFQLFFYIKEADSMLSYVCSLIVHSDVKTWKMSDTHAYWHMCHQLLNRRMATRNLFVNLIFSAETEKCIHAFPGNLSLYLGVPIFIAFPIKRRTCSLDTATSKHNSILSTKSKERNVSGNFSQK